MHYYHKVVSFWGLRPLDSRILLPRKKIPSYATASDHIRFYFLVFLFSAF